MPVVFIECPPGIRTDAKKKIVEKVTSAIDEAFHIGDTLVFLREYVPENVAMNGLLQSENPKIVDALKKITAWIQQENAKTSTEESHANSVRRPVHANLLG